jgi:multimeric flavodoxin WrbA
VDGATNAGAEVTTFSLAQLKVLPCVACDTCHRTGECRIKDDFAKVGKAMLAADGIILASPNYLFSVTAQLKALLDRCNSYIHLQSLSGKYGVGVVTSGGQAGSEVEEYLLRVLRALGAWTVGSVGAEGWRLGKPATAAPCLQQAARLGERLVRAVQQRETFPAQAGELQAFARRMRDLVSMRKDDWRYEFAQWSARERE